MTADQHDVMYMVHCTSYGLDFRQYHVDRIFVNALVRLYTSSL